MISSPRRKAETAIPPWVWRRKPCARPAVWGGVMVEAPKDSPLNWWGALEALRGAYADKTVHENQADFISFDRWCRERNDIALPANAATVAAYVAHGFDVWSPRTVERRAAVIRKVHRLLDCPDPTRMTEVQLAFRRGYRAKGRRARQALGLTDGLRERLLAACPPHSLLGLRDRALIQVGYDTLCRRSELINLRVEDVTYLAEGGAKVLIRKAKTDPYGLGCFAYISARGATELAAWLARAGLGGGPIFRPVYGETVAGRALHPRVVNRVLQGAAERSGLPAEVVRGLSGHSLRVGAAQDLAVAGKSVLQIMRAGRWTSVEVVGAYVRKADVNVWK